jgi:hypothetical protein
MGFACGFVLKHKVDELGAEFVGDRPKDEQDDDGHELR